MLRHLVALLFLWMCYAMPAAAQFYPTQYRPPNQHWQQLKTPHFNIIYAAENDSSAYRMGQLLESDYDRVQSLVGGTLSDFPIILNNYSDRSNGFVTPLHFRSEIELPPIKGKGLNPQTGNWLTNVGPHELVHALQLSNMSGYNIPRLVGLFSPDLARSFHTAIPSGMLEGIAVQHETEALTPHGGRGHYPYFTDQFNATFSSSQRWSMGQLFQVSSRTLPFNRHYIGGYEFTSWLQQKYGEQTTRKALDFYMDYPFLGYGVALRHVTGQWPNELYNHFEDDQQSQLAEEHNRSEQSRVLSVPFDGRNIRRPQWVSGHELLFYGSFYNARPGFYRYDVQEQNLELMKATNSTGDYRYALSPDGKTLVYSYYETDSIYNNAEKTELVSVSLSDGKSRQLTENGRLYAPAFEGNSLLALQTRPASSRIVSLSLTTEGTRNSKPAPVFNQPGTEIKAVATNPVTEEWAVVANRGGQQGLWFTRAGTITRDLKGSPDLAFENGSIFDPEWHPEGNRILFSSDASSSFQLYEYNLNEQKLTQITDLRFGAFEGSYSPGGDSVAFVEQVENERLPAILSRNNFYGKEIPNARFTQTKEAENNTYTISDSLINASQQWTTGPYRTGGSWLKPRTVLPYVDEVGNSGSYQAGIGMHSNSLLADQSYSAEISYFEDRGWYDISYRSKQFFPGYKIRLNSRPLLRPLQDVGTVVQQNRSLALSVPVPIRLNQNVYHTSLYLEPEIRYNQNRLLDVPPDGQNSDFVGSPVINLYAQFNYRLQQNIRDLQPNTGLTIYSELEHYLGSDRTVFSYSGNELTLSAPQLTGLRGGIYGYLSPLRRWNQSLRLGIHALTQTGFVFDNQSQVSEGFSELVLPQSQNLVGFDTRYTIPLTYVDDGGLLLPVFLSNLYLVAFSNSVTDPTENRWIAQSRSVFGLGIRAQFRLSNLAFNIGVGVGYEPTRSNTRFFIGDF